MLAFEKLMAFVAVRDLGRARDFYRDTLGLRLVGEDQFALAFDAGGTRLRVARVEEPASAAYTVLGWEVKDIIETAKSLVEAKVRFERYPGIEQDDLGVWKSPSGARVAWFKDPDGNTLSITEF